MPRKPRLISTEHPYHITGRCINKEWFRLPMPLVWDIFSDHLYLLKFGFKMRIYSFVLMNNHFHLLLNAPEGNLSQGMHHFMMEVSREITRQSKRINQTFGGPYHSSLVDCYHHFLHAYKYVYRNPVDAGLCERVENYRYSTLHGKLGFSTLHIPIEEDTLLFDDVDGTLRWMNHEYLDDHRQQIIAALRRPTFSLTCDRQSRKPSILEKDLS